MPKHLFAMLYKQNFLQIDEPKQMSHYFPRMSFKHTIFAILLGFSLVKPVAAEIPSGPITLEQCIKTAVENNLSLRISNYQPRIAMLSLDSAYSAYDVRLNLGLTDSHRISKGRQNPLEFTIPTSETDSLRHNIGLNGLIPTGARYSLGLNSSETTGTSANDFPFGSYGSGFNLSVTQPLLRGAWNGNSTRMQIMLSKQQVETSSLGVKQQIMQTVASVETAFYNLIADRQNLTIAEDSLKNAQEDLRIMKIKTNVGTEAKTRLPQLEAEVYSRQASLISVQNSYTNQVNTLKSLMSDDFASVTDKELSPVGELNPIQTVFNQSDSWDKALNNRPDILQSSIALERADIRLKYSKNQIYPQLDLRGTYGLTGSDNAVTSFREKRPYISRSATFDNAFRDIRKGDYPNYSVGLSLNIPIPNRAARADYKTSQAQKEIAILQHKQLEQSIMIDIDSLIRQAESSYERIEATRLARVSGELAVKNERTLRDEGASTDFVVLRAERDLTSRRYSEIRAKADYLIALSRLALAEGSTLENRGITVEFVEE
jgi:HAE1 family hydrophobic/amphiphilic exporter-1